MKLSGNMGYIWFSSNLSIGILISIVLKNTKGTKLCTHLRESFANHSFYDILRKFTEKLSSDFSNELVTNFFSRNSGGITGISY